MAETATVELSSADYIDLLSKDNEFFNREFFPDTVRQESPLFHQKMDAILDDPSARYCNLQVFRGGAKTTKLRTFAAKRIAFGISRTIVIVGKSEGHAILTVGWLKRQIMRNTKFARTFKLSRVKGGKWSEEVIQIHNGVLDCDIWVLAYGIHGSTRGINIDDYRPDLILIDDVMDEENTLSPVQRDKTRNLIHGALKNSLAPQSESPLAKLVILQTPLDPEDVSCAVFNDPEFVSLRCGCWTAETEFLPLPERKSAWPARWSDAELQEKKRAAIAANRVSIFSREWECLLITPETSAFREEWLRFWKYPGDNTIGPLDIFLPPRHEMWVVMVIDPVPPPSPTQIAKGLQGKDYEAFAVMARWQGKLFLLESVFNRGHEPSWTVSEFFRLATKWNPRSIHVESVAYQRTLGWLLKQGMKQAGRYWLVDEFTDKRSKDVKIKDGLTGVSSNHSLYVNKDLHGEFITQFVGYGGLVGNSNPDDVIETVALGATALQKGSVAGDESYAAHMDESDIPDLVYERGAP